VIELLEKYRAAKETSAKAARDLGRASGELVYRTHGAVPEVETFLQHPALSTPPRFADLSNAKLGNVLEEAFRGFIDSKDGTLVVGVSLHNPTLAKADDSRVQLEEGPFVLGFVEGMRQSRNQRKQ
jgi:hypothetical protein